MQETRYINQEVSIHTNSDMTKADLCRKHVHGELGERMANQCDSEPFYGIPCALDLLLKFRKWEETNEGEEFWDKVWWIVFNGGGTNSLKIFKMIEELKK